MAMSENSKKVITFLKENNGKKVTSEDVANALGLTKKQVDGCFTSAIQKKDLGVRTPAKVDLGDGNIKEVKFLSLNDAGLALDVDAE